MENSFNVTARVITTCVTLTLIAFLVSSCGIIPHRYQAAPITGQVIDKETGKPVEGVHVAVYWQLYDDSVLGGLGGRVATDVMGVSETVTDKEGFYHIPGWGPVYKAGDYLGEESPMIGFYKTGYKFKEVSNSNMTLLVNKDYISEGYEYNKKETEKGDIYLSDWDGVVVDVVKVRDDIDKMIRNFEGVDRFIDTIIKGKRCESNSIKKFILNYSVHAEPFGELIKDKYPDKARKARFYTIKDLYDRGCGRVREIIK